MKARHISSVLLLLVALSSCKPTASGGGDLRGSLPASDIQGYAYTKSEDANTSTESLVNPAVINLTPLPKGTTSVVIGYKRIVDRKTNTAHTYKNEARIAGKDVTLVVTDTVNNQEVLNVKFPEAQPHAGAQFISANECAADFLCKNGSALQCEANRTCKDQRWATLCCPPDGGVCVSVHGVIQPTTIRCQIISNVVDFNGLVLTQQ